MTLPLTPRQAAFKDLIRRMTVNGISPTYDELSAASGLVKSNVHRMLHRLQERGHVKFAPGRSRTIRIVDGDLPSLEGLSTSQLVRLHSQIEAALANKFAGRAQ